jgi:hypothetical protein
MEDVGSSFKFLVERHITVLPTFPPVIFFVVQRSEVIAE